jgi:hypothetical protein
MVRGDSLIAALRDAAVRREDTRPYGTDKKLREDAASKGECDDENTPIAKGLRLCVSAIWFSRSTGPGDCKIDFRIRGCH